MRDAINDLNQRDTYSGRIQLPLVGWTHHILTHQGTICANTRIISATTVAPSPEPHRDRSRDPFMEIGPFEDHLPDLDFPILRLGMTLVFG